MYYSMQLLLKLLTNMISFVMLACDRSCHMAKLHYNCYSLIISICFGQVGGTGDGSDGEMHTVTLDLNQHGEALPGEGAILINVDGANSMYILCDDSFRRY